jgi:hypothetical protein
MPKHRKRKPKPNPAALFTPKPPEIAQGCTQNVNVSVNIDQKEDGIAGCFRGLFGCCKKSG